MTIVNGHVINEISLDDMSYAITTLYGLLWGTIRYLIMAQVQGPKHVVLALNAPLPY